uniref:Predicted protein n=1 Tax=Hordeum vulgare subsp. vulgare TaxID=112509 RepID=F2E6B1_HORVV|nr:predicted protein [Hordeum vulgare subsp. vulgare]
MAGWSMSPRQGRRPMPKLAAVRPQHRRKWVPCLALLWIQCSPSDPRTSASFAMLVPGRCQPCLEHQEVWCLQPWSGQGNRNAPAQPLRPAAFAFAARPTLAGGASAPHLAAPDPVTCSSASIERRDREEA